MSRTGEPYPSREATFDAFAGRVSAGKARTLREFGIDVVLPLLAPERDEVEARWLASPPVPREAFAEADRLLERWLAAVSAAPGPDRRPPWVRRSWRVRDRRAGLGPDPDHG